MSGSGDDGAGIGFGFAFRGLNQICKYHSIRDLKTFRTVSQAWNDAVSFHPRYRGAKVTLGAAWFREANALQMGHLTSWTNVNLHLFHYTRNSKFFPSVWKTCGQNVTHLNLRKVKLSCTEFNGFLNICPALRSLTINDMDFDAETAGLVVHPQPQGVRGGGGEPPVDRHAIYCSHTQRYQHSGPEPLLPPTIQHLRFEAMRYFPFCSLDCLAERCRGKLEKFEMENNPSPLDLPIHRTPVLRPSLVEIRSRLTRLISENTDTLTSFTFFNNGVGLEFLTDVGNQVPNLSLVELILSVHVPRRPHRERHRRQQHPLNLDPFMNLIRDQLMKRLRRLFFKTRYTAEVRTGFADMRAAMGNLEKLKLSFDGKDHDQVFDIAFLNTLRITELNLMGTAQSEGRQENVFTPLHVFPNCNYWITLPQTIRSFECAHKLAQTSPASISQALTNNRLNLLTKLVVRDARLFTDVMVQQIIEHLTQLQDLTLRYGLKLSDSAFTGISPALAKSLWSCGSYSVLTGTDGMTVRPETRSIKELVHLRKLNLAGCTIVSDISCRYGFANLESIDLTECCHVSDMGLYWLGRSNPRLKEVHLRKNAKVSHFGLNQFLYQLKSVTKVSISRVLLDRRLGNSTYVRHPLLDEIACVASENHVQVAKYRREF